MASTTAPIRLRHPVVEKMANGLACVLLTEAGTWESFPAFAEAFTAQFDATIVKRIDGPDVRIWTLMWRGERFQLAYDDYPNGISLEPVDASAEALLHELLEALRSESSPDGI